MAKTPEEQKEYLRQYHLKNKDKAKVQMKAWNEANREHMVAHRKGEPEEVEQV